MKRLRAQIICCVASVMLVTASCQGNSDTNLPATKPVAMLAQAPPSQGQLNSQLLKACENNDFESAKAALDAGADPDASKDRNWPCALEYAAAYSDNRIFKLLIESGAKEFNRKLRGSASRFSSSPLERAIINENFEAADILLSRGADSINLGLTTKVAQIGSITALQYLLDMGEDLNQDRGTKHGPPPILEAFTLEDESKCLAIIQFMLSHGVDITKGKYLRFSPLNKAAEKNYLTVAQVLLEKGADPTWVDLDKDDAFSCAKTPEMKALLEKYRR